MRADLRHPEFIPAAMAVGVPIAFLQFSLVAAAMSLVVSGVLGAIAVVVAGEAPHRAAAEAHAAAVLGWSTTPVAPAPGVQGESLMPEVRS